jgi:hypothetical protein
MVLAQFFGGKGGREKGRKGGSEKGRYLFLTPLLK